MLNQRVKVKIRARNSFGKLSSEFTEIIGLCTFIGKNEILSWPLQVTVSRCPYEIRDINDIQIHTT